jgi:predicted HD phosphohydrolase
MPERPTLKHFYELRLSKTGTKHMLQSAKVARENGLDEKVIMACLVHDIAIAGLLSANHGYWGAQMVAPYVDEEVAWNFL